MKLEYTEDKMYLGHILESAQEIQGYITGIDKRTFLRERIVQDAVIRRFEILGEATKRLTKHVQSQKPAIPWKRIAGMRDRLIHDYFSVDLDLVWQTAKKELPSLIRAVDQLLNEKPVR